MYRLNRKIAPFGPLSLFATVMHALQVHLPKLMFPARLHNILPPYIVLAFRLTVVAKSQRYTRRQTFLLSVMLQGIGWDYVGKPTSPINSVVFSDYNTTPSTKSSGYSPSSSPTFSCGSTPLRERGTPGLGCRSKTPSESSCGGSRSSLLEEFRSHMSSFVDLSEIKGHVLEFSRDQVKVLVLLMVLIRFHSHPHYC